MGHQSAAALMLLDRLSGICRFLRTPSVGDPRLRPCAFRLARYGWARRFEPPLQLTMYSYGSFIRRAPHALLFACSFNDKDCYTD